MISFQHTHSFGTRRFGVFSWHSGLMDMWKCHGEKEFGVEGWQTHGAQVVKEQSDEHANLDFDVYMMQSFSFIS